MVDISNPDWSTTDGSNTQSPPNGWPNGMAPNQVRPTAQQMMGATKRLWERSGPALSTTGSAGAYIYTPSNTSYPTAYIQGDIYVAKANFTSVGGDTLNVNSLGALPLYKPSSSGPIAIVAADIASGQIFEAAYDSALNSGSGGFQITAGITPASGGGGGGTASVGYVLNGRMSVTAASATATFTADVVVPSTALNGTAYSLSSYSQAINLGTTGAGGMDNGSAPASGFVSLYAIYNPGSITTSILAINASTSSGTIYSGTHMPSGYTASALIGVWPTDGSRRFVVGFQLNRSISIVPGTVVLSGGTASSYTAVDLSSAVPPNTKTVNARMSGGNSKDLVAYSASSTSGIGEQLFTAAIGGLAPLGMTLQMIGMSIITTQTIYYKASSSEPLSIQVNGYTF